MYLSKRFSLFKILSFLFLGSFIVSCDKNDDMDEVVVPQDAEFFALGQSNKLIRYNGKNLSTPLNSVTISGLQSGDNILGIDFRPATGQLFGISSLNRLYTINVTTGAATVIGTAAFSPALSNTVVGFDFNPTVDRIRVVTATGQNLRLNPENGAVAATDGNISVGSASITSVAYTQNRPGAMSTTLFDIDVAADKLYRQDPPNNGTLVEVGNLGVNAEGASGFDISSDSAFALAALKVNGRSSLYSINLSTGAATKAGDFSEEIIGIAIPTVPPAYAISTSNTLVIFNPLTGVLGFNKPITGLGTGENIVGIDMRPATGQLYALGSLNKLYTINASTGAATVVGTGIFSQAVLGTDFGFDFNPVVDRIRIVSDLGRNYRLDPNDGATVTADGNINPSTNVITGSAYANNFAGTTTTTLFNIDASADRLVRQDPPNAGTIVDIGALGVNVESTNGFDIGGTSGVAYGLFTVSGTTRIYTVNLTTGAATAGATISVPVRAFAIGLGL